MSLSDSLQRVRRCSSVTRELDLGKNGLWYDRECLICYLSCSSVNDCDTFTLCMHRKV